MHTWLTILLIKSQIEIHINFLSALKRFVLFLALKPSKQIYNLLKSNNFRKLLLADTISLTNNLFNVRVALSSLAPILDSYLKVVFTQLQANSGPSVAAADVVQTAADGAGHQEGSRCHYFGTIRAACTLAGSCKSILSCKFSAKGHGWCRCVAAHSLHWVIELMTSWTSY